MRRSLPCSVGRGGIGIKQGEGDGVTPAGIHRIEAVKWRGDRIPNPYPSGTLPIPTIFGSSTRIGLTDGWSDDPKDPAYNSQVKRPHGFSHETLRRADPLYDLIAVLDFNRDPVKPGKGSAIFLHVWRKPRHQTEGCIAFRREDLTWILRNWTRHSRVVVQR